MILDVADEKKTPHLSKTDRMILFLFELWNMYPRTVGSYYGLEYEPDKRRHPPHPCDRGQPGRVGNVVEAAPKQALRLRVGLRRDGLRPGIARRVQ